jgi:hypothetical protein
MAHKLEWKKVIDKIDEWAAWQGANAKIDKISLSILKKFINISKEDMEDYNLDMFTHVMESSKDVQVLKN